MKVVRFSEAKVADVVLHDIFDKAYEGCPRIVDFKPEWTTSMGFFDNAIQGEHALKIKPGRMLRSVVPTSGRRALFVGTHMGVVAVYERLTGNDQLSVRSIYYQSTRDFEETGFVSHTQPDDYELALLLGDKTNPNIGMRIERMVSYVNSKDKADDVAGYTAFTNINATVPKEAKDIVDQGAPQRPKAVKPVGKIRNVMRDIQDPPMVLPKAYSKGTYLAMGRNNNSLRLA